MSKIRKKDTTPSKKLDYFAEALSSTNTQADESQHKQSEERIQQNQGRRGYSSYNKNNNQGYYQDSYEENYQNYSYYDSNKQSYTNSYNENTYDYNNYNHYNPKPKAKKQNKPVQSGPNKSKQKEAIKRHLSKLEVEVPELTRTLIDELIDESIECMICNDYVHNNSEIWECEKCYTIYHNKCIYDWINKLNPNKGEKIKEFKWTCPHCNNYNQAASDKLPVYNCFCRSFYKPETKSDPCFNPNLIPHACGLACKYQLCKHLTCPLPCHPGPHVVCNVVEPIKCFCGKTEKEFLCANSRIYSCEQVCGKVLSCNRHFCKEICHDLPCETFLKNKKCEECVSESKKKFLSFLQQLEAKIRTETGNEINIAKKLLDYVFDGMLLCGKHFVEPNTDNNLKFLLKLLQVSGKNLVQNIQTFIPICKEPIDNSCDCHSKSSKTVCYKLNYDYNTLKFLGLESQVEKRMENCTRVCKGLKSCKIHKCTKVCCELMNRNIINYTYEDPNGYHLCLNLCKKDLNCGEHKCEDYCHRGNCKPCTTIIRSGIVSCECGKTKMEPPYICGAVPFCRMPCSKPRKCEHVCKLTCHVGDCPPCEEITYKLCRCKKNVINNMKCGDNAPACQTTCGEMLACGVHFCTLICHDHTEEFDKDYFCTMICGREMSCGHKCSKRCHGEEDCQETDCEIIVKLYCKCKATSKQTKCGDVKRLYDGDINYHIDCTDECERQNRLKKIELAFDGLLKYNNEKHKQLMKTLANRNGSETNKPDSARNDLDGIVDYSTVKFDHHAIKFAKHKTKYLIEIENIIEKALRNMSVKYEIPKLDKKLYVLTCEFLKLYYNIKVEKSKMSSDTLTTIILSDCSEAFIPRYRLSLFGILFKHEKFVKYQNLPINHPFEMTIHIANYRYQVEPDEVEAYMVQLGCVKNDFYVDEIEKGKCYVHFFNASVGKKIFEQLKNRPSQYQECYDIYYKEKSSMSYDDLYLYLKNTEYFDLLYNSHEGGVVTTGVSIKQEKPIEDAEGFVKVQKKKKPKPVADEDGFVSVEKNKKSK